ncbi:MAG: HAMP domain-containing histidine kinase [Bacteroidales bacterium]|nr:HAMP domain-containing histidine kinase [Bacteroidales bacterium]
MILAIVLFCLLVVLAVLAFKLYSQNAQYKKYLKKIEDRDKIKSEFLKNLTQEIRTPLDSVVGFADVCCSFEDLSEEERKDYVYYIHKNCDTLLRLLTGVLDVARYDSLAPDVQLETFDLGDEIINTLTALESGLQSNGDVKIDYSDANNTFMVFADRTMLQRIMFNLVHNAIKFTKKGEVDIKITSVEGGFVKVSVEDTGCGIAPEKLSSIFAKSYKVDSLAQGTGLGLFLCKTLVELQGGKIGVESKLGEGSKFWFTLPVSK